MPKTVLLADDSVTIQKVVGISFASEDVTLVTVDNGDDAVTKAREVHPDVILADVVMPGKSGYEVCEAVKSDPSLQHIPVLLLTGTFEAFDDERARAAGAAGHVAKPFEAQTLIDQVNRLLAESAAAPAAMPPAPSPIDIAPAQDDAFDFFDDDGGDLQSSERATTASPEPLDLDTPEPFAFGDDTLEAEAVVEPLATVTPTDAYGSRPRAGDMTVALLGDDEPLAAVEAEADLLSLEPDALPLTASGPGLAADPSGDSFPGPDPAAGSSDDIFDFDFEGGADATGGSAEGVFRVGPDDLAQATMLDPDGAADFDVSAADLGDPLATELLSSPGGEPVLKPDPEPRLAPEPLPAPRPVLQPARDARPAASDPTAQAQAALERVSPVLQEQLHATIEKVAWDALGNLSEEIVQQAVERVERIAWEVIPQMAEALIREEIRRMKGSDEP